MINVNHSTQQHKHTRAYQVAGSHKRVNVLRMHVLRMHAGMTCTCQTWSHSSFTSSVW